MDYHEPEGFVQKNISRIFVALCIFQTIQEKNVEYMHTQHVENSWSLDINANNDKSSFRQPLQNYIPSVC